MESVRTVRGPRQRVVATIGKLPGLNEAPRVGWEHIGDFLDGKMRTADIFSRPPEVPEWATVDVKGLWVERLRSFGDVYLGLALWKRLRLDSFFNEAIAPGREEIARATMSAILTLARFCALRRIWVMDRGMVSEANLDMFREAQASVGTPKSMPRNFERHLLDENDWSKIETGVEVKFCAAPENSQETFALCPRPFA